VSEQAARYDVADQPQPKPGREDVPPLARAEFERVMDTQTRKGLATYGTVLQTHNGRDAVADAKAECVDLWQYLCQVGREVEDMRVVCRLLAACSATPVTGLAGYVDVRVPVDVWRRVREAGE
jgi:hypothetical protein